MFKTATQYISEITGEPILFEYVTEGPWHMTNTGGVECEVGEFLFGLVRMMMPENILETGTFTGVSSSYIGLALQNNERGHLDTIEWDEGRMEEAKKKWAKLELNDFIIPHRMSSLEFVAKKQYELVFLDSEPMTRFQELDKFWNSIKPGGIIVLHDLHSEMGTSSGVWDNLNLIENKIKNHQLTVMHFYTPRGLTLCRKANTTEQRPDYVYKLLTK